MPDGGLRRHRKLHAFENDHIASAPNSRSSTHPMASVPESSFATTLTWLKTSRITALLGAEVLLAPHQTGGCRTHNPHLMGLIDRQVWDNRARDPQAIRDEILGERGVAG
mgnify:CR=1 FL=1